MVCFGLQFSNFFLSLLLQQLLSPIWFLGRVREGLDLGGDRQDVPEGVLLEGQVARVQPRKRGILLGTDLELPLGLL